MANPKGTFHNHANMPKNSTRHSLPYGNEQINIKYNGNYCIQ
jgi:hypothetical protein